MNWTKFRGGFVCTTKLGVWELKRRDDRWHAEFDSHALFLPDAAPITLTRDSYRPGKLMEWAVRVEALFSMQEEMLLGYACRDSVVKKAASLIFHHKFGSK